MKDGLKTSVTVSGVGGKTYYIRVCSFKTISKGNIYSYWSAGQQITNTVKPAIKLDMSKATAYVGDTLQLQAAVTGASNKVTWSSGNTKIATVSGSGEVTCKSPGIVEITAKANGVTAVCKVTVTLKVGSVITFGSYEQDDITSNGKEPIRWIVLQTKGIKALLISEYGLDTRKYHDIRENVTWEKCTLRKWLNSTFYQNAFSSAEQKIILTSSITAEDGPYDVEGGNNTRDKVFLLSISEAENFFESDAARLCVPTNYARARSASTQNGYCGWWLRTPGVDSELAARGSTLGWIDAIGSYVDYGSECIRPAIWINPVS